MYSESVAKIGPFDAGISHRIDMVSLAILVEIYIQSSLGFLVVSYDLTTIL
jgi:hypothetical protein